MRDCCECVWNKPSEKLRRLSQVVPARVLLESAAIDILGPLLKTSNCIQFVLMMKYSFPKWARDIKVSKTAVANITFMLMDHRTFLYGIPDFMPTYHWMQFTSRFFESFCVFLWRGYFKTTAYYFQTNGQAERLDKTILSRLRYYRKKQWGWHIYVQMLTYANNSQGHRWTNLRTFSLVFSRHPRDLKHSIILRRCRLTLWWLHFSLFCEHSCYTNNLKCDRTRTSGWKWRNILIKTRPID